MHVDVITCIKQIHLVILPKSYFYRAIDLILLFFTRVAPDTVLPDIRYPAGSLAGYLAESLKGVTKKTIG